MELLQKALFNFHTNRNSSEGSQSLDKLGLHTHFPPHLDNSIGVEPVNPNIVFDVASLVLYGTQAIPVRLKILLDRLFSVLSNEEVCQILKGYGWTLEDYQIGYILKDLGGEPLERWQMVSKEQERLVLQQFLRFGETRPITQKLLLQELSEASNDERRTRAQNEISRLNERNSFIQKLEQGQLSNQQPFRPSNHDSDKDSETPSRSVEKSPFLKPGNGALLLSPLNKLAHLASFDYRRRRDDKFSEDLDEKGPGNAFLPSLRSSIIPSSSSSLSHSKTFRSGHLKSHQDRSSKFSDCVALNLTNSTCNNSNNNNNTSGTSSGGSGSQGGSPSKKERRVEVSRNGEKEPPGPGGEENNIGVISVEMRKKLRDNIGISYVSPTTGKKRVQCNVCLKTFCDKGALKIHFSAVHLREMHKCSVEGCNMMFSSRRSRNRHSSNPNPKLHTPHLRRKISPHDGRTHQGPLISPFAGLSSKMGNSFSPFPVSSNGLYSLLQQQQQRRHQQSKIYKTDTSGFSEIEDSKKSRLSDSDNTESDKYSLKDEGTLENSSNRKRKSNNPTRVLSEETGPEFSSDDDDEGFENPCDEYEEDYEDDIKSTSYNENPNDENEKAEHETESEKAEYENENENKNENKISVNSETLNNCSLDETPIHDSFDSLKAHVSSSHFLCSHESCKMVFFSKRERDDHVSFCIHDKTSQVSSSLPPLTLPNSNGFPALLFPGLFSEFGLNGFLAAQFHQFHQTQSFNRPHSSSSSSPPPLPLSAPPPSHS